MIKRDAILAELLEIECLLQDDRLSDEDRHALHGSQQALRNVLDPETWHSASQKLSPGQTAERDRELFEPLTGTSAGRYVRSPA